MAAIELVQSTATTVQLGPFLDATDGVTAETGLTPGIEVSKGGAAFVTANDGTATHDAEGWYRIDLDATDTNTLGSLVVKAQDSANHLPVWREFSVQPVQTKTPPVISNYIGIIKESAAQVITVGPFISRSTGLPLTSMTVGDITCILQKGGIPASSINTGTLTLTASGGSNDLTHASNGLWTLELTSTNTNAVGFGKLMFRDDDVFYPVVVDFQVMENLLAASYLAGYPQSDCWYWRGSAVPTPVSAGYPRVDMHYMQGDFNEVASLIAAIDTSNGVVKSDLTYISGDSAAADNLETACDGGSYNVGGGAVQTDVRKLVGMTTGANNLAKSALAIVPSNAVTGTLSTTQFTTALTEATDDHYNGRTVIFTSGALANEAREITDYDGATKMITVAAMTDAPSNSDTFVIV